MARSILNVLDVYEETYVVRLLAAILAAEVGVITVAIRVAVLKPSKSFDI
jgi:hypothetical protein